MNVTWSRICLSGSRGAVPAMGTCPSSAANFTYCILLSCGNLECLSSRLPILLYRPPIHHVKVMHYINQLLFNSTTTASCSTFLLFFSAYSVSSKNKPHFLRLADNELSFPGRRQPFPYWLLYIVVVRRRRDSNHITCHLRFHSVHSRTGLPCRKSRLSGVVTHPESLRPQISQ